MSVNNFVAQILITFLVQATVIVPLFYVCAGIDSMLLFHP